MKNFVLFGASGDLAFEKLYPALFQLYDAGIKFDGYLGFARSEIDDFQHKIIDSIQGKDVGDKEALKEFASKWHYIQAADYAKDGISKLKEKIKSKEEAQNTYYLALPIIPDLIGSMLEAFKTNQLIGSDDLFVFEKPFGRDYQSAKHLFEIIHRYLNDDQIWMVDHYLGKNMVRNIISLRFANPLLEAVWDASYIDCINIKATEAEGIKGRAKYYDQTGAIRDMVQNHLLQILALVTMEGTSISAQAFTKAKIKLLESVRIFNEDFENSLKIKQYDGYRNEDSVSEDSMTETYAEIRFEVNTQKWNGVPINTVTAKKLDKKETVAEICFKKNLECVWGTECDKLDQNKLAINIYPDQSVELALNAGFSPLKDLPKTVDLSFNLGGITDGSVFSNPYANVLKDVYNRDFLYAITLEEVLTAWQIIDEVMNYIDETGRKKLLGKY